MKKRGNLLGRNNHLVLSTDREKFWHLEDAEESIPSQSRTVWTCNYGFLLISQERVDNRSSRSYEFYIWKPESSEVINLPPLSNLKPNQEIVAGTLLSPPGLSGSMVILFEEYLRYIIYYRYGDKQWTMRWIGKEITYISRSNNAREIIFAQSITYCNKKLYAATFGGYLMVIEEDRAKNLKLRPLNVRLPSSFSPSCLIKKYLLDSCGQLCFVEVFMGGIDDDDIIDMDVFKLESIENMMVWVRMKSAEDRAFFLSNNYAFSCPVNEPEIQGSHIYLLHRNRFYSINIKDKSFSASLSLQNLKELKKSPFMAMQDLIRLCNLQAKPEHPINTLEVEKEKRLIEDNNEAEAKATNFCDLQYDVLGFIAERLYLVDYINFRSVCHNFRLATPRIKWSESPFKSKFPSLSPWLVFSNSCAIYNFIDLHFGDRYLIKIPECLLHGKIRYSHDGWLLICNPSSMFFYQPFTKELIVLPQGVGEGIQNCCLGYALSSSPTLAESILVGISFYCLYYFCRSEGRWVECQLPHFYDFIPNYNSPVYFDGAFYFLGGEGQVAVFELNNGRLLWKILQELQSPCDHCSYNYLLECGGNLLSVFVVDQFVYVYKLNFGALITWEKVTSLKNYALFVSPASSFSMIVNSSHMENKVYFRNLCGMDIIYYCLITDKFYTCRNKKVVPDFMNTTELMLSTWIKPRWQL